MAEKISRTVNAKFSMLHGIVIRSTIESGTVLGVTLPDLDSRFVVVGPRDVLGENSVQVFGDSMPLFASSQVTYQGQPLLAIFGPDAETVEVKAREIEVDFQLPASQSTQISKESNVVSKSLEYSWGDIGSVMKEAVATVERTYTDRGECTSEHTLSIVRVTPTDDNLVVEAPTQWPFHVHRTVAQTCGRPEKKIVVNLTTYFSVKDEFLLLPSILASIAALAAIKSNRPVQISSRFPTYKPQVTINRKTALDTTKKPIGEALAVTVDQGASSFFSDEMFRQLLAGLIPQYQLQAFALKVDFKVSNHAPAHFYGDLGYSTAVFSSEAHASAIARETQMNPANWRLKYYTEYSERAAVITTTSISKLRDIIGEICATSDFARHSAVYELQRRMRKPLSTFLNYTRGVGIACSAGVSGFSSTFASLPQFRITLTLDANNKVVLNTSFLPTQRISSLWKALIAKELNIERETIILGSPDTATLVDSGPNVLSQQIERFSQMIIKACAAIKAKRFQMPLPLVETIHMQEVAPTQGALFQSGTWGALILELEVNTITLQVEIRHIRCSFLFSQIFDKKALIARLRHIIMLSLEECGAVFNSVRDNSPALIVTVAEQTGAAIPGSTDSALRGMILAAYSSALSQALNSEVNTLPVKGDDIIGFMRKIE
jgi:CO/xanthine dehydrogenase Mo-binding subunit